MRIKLSWVPFIPIAILSVFLRIYQVMFVSSGVDTGFLSDSALWVIYAGLVAVLFLVIGILSLSDKKTSGIYSIGKNFFAGLFAVITGALLCFGAGMEIMQIINSNDIANTYRLLFDAVFSIAGGIVFMIMGVSSIAGSDRIKRAKGALLLPPLWCCVRLMTTFIDYSHKSPNSFDMTDIFILAFMTLFVFGVSMIYGNIQGKNPVKAVFLYGLPGIVVTFAYAAVSITQQILSGQGFVLISNTQGVSNINTIQYLALSLYAIFFIIELTTKAKLKDDDELAENNSKKDKKAKKVKKDAKIISEAISENIVAENAVLPGKNNKVQMLDVDDSVKQELDSVDNVIDNIDKEENDPDKADPLSNEFLSNAAVTQFEDDDVDGSMADIDKLIAELESEDK